MFRIWSNAMRREREAQHYCANSAYWLGVSSMRTGRRPLSWKTPEERCFALLRTEDDLRDKSNQELRQLLQDNPMLEVEISMERELDSMVKWAPEPVPVEPLPQKAQPVCIRYDPSQRTTRTSKKGPR
jgi:hypothetical protein